ncbi:DEAD-box ATP-dependent RNA helicase 17 [Porphyridium purpureum]|uniref:ATP-dependent RNA helicase n=1 Tax=Porphyridium purpureum TaxID=35688 RepID=A0A5J4YUL7_PORPP|nr:DEAD-box ATP-dependent RNA helicase 17 [Porphyridium purpureum]|eukprot:POR1979..scf229_5
MADTFDFALNLAGLEDGGGQAVSAGAAPKSAGDDWFRAGHGSYKKQKWRASKRLRLQRPAADGHQDHVPQTNGAEEKQDGDSDVLYEDRTQRAKAPLGTRAERPARYEVQLEKRQLHGGRKRRIEQEDGHSPLQPVARHKHGRGHQYVSDADLALEKKQLDAVNDFVHAHQRAERTADDHEDEDEAQRIKLSPLTENDTAAFLALNLNSSLAGHLARRMGFTEPTPVQSSVVRAYMHAIHAHESRILSRRVDMIIRSETGSGKTLAYLLPIAEALLIRRKRVERSDGARAIILTPTRELAAQVEMVARQLLHPWHWIVVGSIMGGERRKSEKARIRKGITVIVSTPGRLLDHMENTQSLSLKLVEFLVFDEADRLMDLGFEDAIREIVRQLDLYAVEGDKGEGGGAAVQSGAATRKVEGLKRRSNFLVSATMPGSVKHLADTALHNPISIVMGGTDGQHLQTAAQLEEEEKVVTDTPGTQALRAPAQLRQHFCLVEAKHRLVALICVLRLRSRSAFAKSMVFFSSCDSVDFHYLLLRNVELPPVLRYDKGVDFGVDKLKSGTGPGSSGASLQNSLCGVPVFKIHGQMVQEERNRAFHAFRLAKRGVLLCTDVGARGLDLPHLSLTLQYDPPTKDESVEYLHRAGRTARIGMQGDSLLFLLPSEAEYARVLQQRGLELKEVSCDATLAALLLGNPAYEGLSLGQLARTVTRTMQETISSAVEKGLQPSKVSRQGYDETQKNKHESSVREGEDDEDSDGETPPSRQEKVTDAKALATSASNDALQKERAARGQELRRLAASAFRAYVRAYATHARATRHIFNIKGIHLGHLARSFGLNRSPAELDSLVKQGRSSGSSRTHHKANANTNEHTHVDSPGAASAKADRKSSSRMMKIGDHAVTSLPDASLNKLGARGEARRRRDARRMASEFAS